MDGLEGVEETVVPEGLEEGYEDPQGEALGEPPAPEDPVEDEDILPLDHSAEYPPEVNKLIRIAKQRGKKLDALSNEAQTLRNKSGELEQIQEAIDRGDLIFKRDVEHLLQKPEPELGDGEFGVPELDEAYRTMAEDGPEGTKRLFQTLAQQVKTIKQLQDRLERSDTHATQTGMRNYLAQQLESRGVKVEGGRFDRLVRNYSQDLVDQGFTPGKEGAAASSKILDGILGDMNIRPAKKTSQTPPSTTGRRGAPLRPKRNMEPQANMSREDILAEIRAGNLG